ncbi:MAG: Tryptophan 2,3-dioxygenase [Paucimonas sp.]|nr:Tryptophan 2,3-dioxygenase [Paucimonas sp.]
MVEHAGCPHLFVGKRPQRPHYCSYIQVERLLDTFPATLSSTEDRLFYSFCSSSVLWLHQQSSDLGAVHDALTSKPVQFNYAEACKRLRRCLAVANILSQQSLLARAIAHGGRNQAGLRVAAGATLPLLAQTSERMQAVASLLERRRKHKPDAGDELDLTMTMLIDCQQQFEARTRQVLQAFSSPEASLPLSDLVDAGALLESAQVTLRRHHPQALRRGATHDELLFITSHQVFEMWFPSVLALLDDAIDQLLSERPALTRVEATVRRVQAFYRLFCEMIQMPQAMSAADYLAFRSQLEGGSGLESVGFRALEITIGQRDPILLRNLLQMQLNTDELATRLARPSLSDAYLAQLHRAGVIADPTDLEQAAKAIARAIRPTGAPNPHGELMALGETMLELEQAMETWRRNHLSMVDRMIGYRQSLGVAGDDPQPMEAQGCPVHAGKKDGRPYLLQTLGYRRAFSYLWEARTRLREEDMRRWLGAPGTLPLPVQAVRPPRVPVVEKA